MKTMQLVELQDKVLKCVSYNEGISSVYELINGHYLKIFDRPIIYATSILGIDLEKRIKQAKPVPNVEEILIPNTIIYNGYEFIGYIIESAKGIPYDDYQFKIPKDDLYKYSLLYSKVEDAVKRANDQGVIFPDLLTISNIFVKKGKGKIEFIDYDGLQINDGKTYQLSTALGNEKKYENSKYSRGPLLYTKNLDIKSLLHLYFLTTFNLDLSKIGQINPIDGQIVRLEDYLKALNIDDYDLAHKMWLATSDTTHDNEYLGQTVFDIADKYDLKIVGRINSETYIKKLVRKK